MIFYFYQHIYPLPIRSIYLFAYNISIYISIIYLSNLSHLNIFYILFYFSIPLLWTIRPCCFYFSISHLEKLGIRVVCPNFGHRALTSSFNKHKTWQKKNSFATIVNEVSFWNCISFQMVILLFRSIPTASTKYINPKWRS